MSQIILIVRIYSKRPMSNIFRGLLMSNIVLHTTLIIQGVINKVVADVSEVI